MTADDFIFSWNRAKNIGYQSSFLASDYWSDAKALDPDAPAHACRAERRDHRGPDRADADGRRQQGRQGAWRDRPAGHRRERDRRCRRFAQRRHRQGYIDNLRSAPVRIGWSSTIATARSSSSAIRTIGAGRAAGPDHLAQHVEPNKQLEAVQVGEADMAFDLETDSVQAVKDDPDLQLLTAPTLAIEYMAINTNPSAVPSPTSRYGKRSAGRSTISRSPMAVWAALRSNPQTCIPLGLTGTEEAKDLGYSYDLAKAGNSGRRRASRAIEFEMTYDSDHSARGWRQSRDARDDRQRRSGKARRRHDQTLPRLPAPSASADTAPPIHTTLCAVDSGLPRRRHVCHSLRPRRHRRRQAR